MPDIEVHVDHVRGIVAVGWPTVPGYVFYREGAVGEGQVATPYTLPAGMTRLVAPPAPAAKAACASTRTIPLAPRHRPRPDTQQLPEGA